jgi:hypothetical protein
MAKACTVADATTLVIVPHPTSIENSSVAVFAARSTISLRNAAISSGAPFAIYISNSPAHALKLQTHLRILAACFARALLDLLTPS